MFVEEKLLKLEYQIIAQKLAAVKVKKIIAAQQTRIGDEATRHHNAPRRLHEQATLLEQCINLGEWKTREDAEFVAEQRNRLTQHKRKMEQNNAPEQLQVLQDRIRQLEEQMEQEVQRRLRDEHTRLERERQHHQRHFAAEAAQLQDMMNAASTTVADLNRVRKRRRIQPEASASRAEESNDDVIFMGAEADDIEPD